MRTLLLFIVSATVLAAQPRPISLNEVGDLVRAKRALNQLTDDQRVAFVVSRSGDDGRFDVVIEDRYLFACAPGFSRIFGKEVLFSRSVEHLKLTAKKANSTPTEIRESIEQELNKIGVTLLAAGSSILVLAPIEKNE